MNDWLQVAVAFCVGGAICALVQVMLEKTKITSPKMLVILVVAGAAISAFGWYEPFAEWAGAGASVPLLGFGHVLAQGSIRATREIGWQGLFTGGLAAGAGGVAAAVVFGLFAAVLFKPRSKP